MITSVQLYMLKPVSASLSSFHGHIIVNDFFFHFELGSSETDILVHYTV